MQGMTSSMKWIANLPCLQFSLCQRRWVCIGLLVTLWHWFNRSYFTSYTQTTYANRRQEGLTNADLRRGKGKSLVAPGVGPVDESTTLLDGKSVSKSGQKKSSNKKSNKSEGKMTKMRQRVEATGKTYEDALQNGLEALGVDQTADVSVEVIEEGQPGGILGIGRKDYRLLLTIKAKVTQLMKQRN